MLIEKTMKEAFNAFFDGHEVKVLLDQETKIKDLSSFMPSSESRYLVECPEQEEVMEDVEVTSEEGQTKTSDKKRIKAERVELTRQYLAEGMKSIDIARKMGLAPSTVHEYVKEVKKNRGRKQDESEKNPGGGNSNKELCEKCKYRTKTEAERKKTGECSYFFITGQLRGGDAKDCKKYEPDIGGKQNV